MLVACCSDSGSTKAPKGRQAGRQAVSSRRQASDSAASSKAGQGRHKGSGSADRCMCACEQQLLHIVNNCADLQTTWHRYSWWSGSRAWQWQSSRPELFCTQGSRQLQRAARKLPRRRQVRLKRHAERGGDSDLALSIADCPCNIHIVVCAQLIAMISSTYSRRAGSQARQGRQDGRQGGGQARSAGRPGADPAAGSRHGGGGHLPSCNLICSNM